MELPARTKAERRLIAALAHLNRAEALLTLMQWLSVDDINSLARVQENKAVWLPPREDRDADDHQRP